MSKQLERFGLRYNPFEPAASGAPVNGALWMPSGWKERLDQLIEIVGTGQGAKVIILSGEYGSGKSYILQWLYREVFPEKRIKPFYFDNPGVQFYDLANSLLRQIGRKDFAKFIWELASVHVEEGYQRSFFANGFEEYLKGQRHKKQNIKPDLQNAVMKAGITTDEEIANCLARIVADTPVKPYFEYRDFIAGKNDALVAEREEASYFGAILRTLQLGAGIEAVAFLIDEFEEVSPQKVLARREAHDYLVTLRRLINLTQQQSLWLVLAMTPQGLEYTVKMQPSLGERFPALGQYKFEIPQLTASDATELVMHRLESARIGNFDPPNKLFPFPDDFTTVVGPDTYSTPRRLVKVCFYAIAQDLGKKPKLPFSADHLRSIENNVYPVESGGKR